MNELGFIHQFVPAPDRRPDRVLLLLHGTGGNESDLIPIGRALDPFAALLSPRGKVLENGMPRFFRRLREGVFDEEDIVRRADELAEFIGAARVAYEFPADPVIAVGFSNGANMAAALLLLRAEVLAGAILFRAMVPLRPETTPQLEGKRILISAGGMDPIVPVDNASELAAMLRAGGADVTFHLEAVGHALVSGDLTTAQAWLRGNEQGR